MIWVHAGTAAEVAARMQGADTQPGVRPVTSPCRQPPGTGWVTLATGNPGCWAGRVTIVAVVSWPGLGRGRDIVRLWLV